MADTSHSPWKKVSLLCYGMAAGVLLAQLINHLIPTPSGPQRSAFQAHVLAICSQQPPGGEIRQQPHRVVAKWTQYPRVEDRDVDHFLDLEVEPNRVARVKAPYQEWKAVEVGQMWPQVAAQGVER